ncbi:MAG: acyl-CoA dehydratase activase [Nitrospinota bacterium]
MNTLGIDVGSRFVKLVGLDINNAENAKLTFAEKVDTIEFYRTCRTQSGVDVKRLELFKSRAFDFERVVATGYGRHNVNIGGAVIVSEIRAHATGARRQTGLDDFTLIDLGGQDTKVVKVRAGEVDDFVMNDKCAAGSGRYLENIARTLGLTVEEVAAHYEDPVHLSATCAIFGESEVIGHVAEGAPIETICAGANLSVAQRLLPLTRKFHSPVFIVAGGAAKNGAVVRFLKERCESDVIVPEHPTFNGALGCAVLQNIGTFKV